MRVRARAFDAPVQPGLGGFRGRAEEIICGWLEAWCDPASRRSARSRPLRELVAGSCDHTGEESVGASDERDLLTERPVAPVDTETDGTGHARHVVRVDRHGAGLLGEHVSLVGERAAAFAELE